jgi:hypothetical protein
MAESEQWRCRCQFGNPCGRKATAEDLLCDWCRGRNHEQACNEQVQREREGVMVQTGERPMTYSEWVRQLNSSPGGLFTKLWKRNG